MKNLITNSIYIGLLALLWVGCSEMVNDPKPETFVSKSDYYNTPQDLGKAVNGAYAVLQSIYYTGYGTDIWAVTEMRTDNTTYQFNPDDRGEFEMESLDEFTIRTDNPQMEALWNSFYRGILQCNLVTDNINSIDFSDAGLKKQYMGEAKFLRAFNYFHLVRLYGGVPLILKSTGSPEEAFTDGRAPIDKVYDQIISDATDAISNLPENYSSSSDKGRATKGAATMLLAEVYMTKGNFSSAIEQLRKITNMGYSLMPNYGDFYKPANKNNQESIFELQYQSGISGGDEASEFIYRFAPYNSGSDIIGFSDLSPSHAGYNIPTVDMVNTYENGDERKDASIAYYVNPENTNWDVAIGDSIPYLKKYSHSFEEPHQTNENWPVYRYSESLLLLAEALNEEGQTGDAYQYINQVRTRAGLNPVAGLSQSSFRDTVYHEERVELAFENKRWYNLKRTGRAVEVMNKHGEEMKQLVPRLTNSTYDVKDYKLTYPIPIREIRLNNFEQNANW